MLAQFGRILFAGGFIAFGIQQFVVSEFVVGRAPGWPEGVSGRVLFAWLTGAAFVASGAALVMERRVRLAAAAAGALVFGWALIRHIPTVAGDVFIGGSWTAAGKAIVILGGLCALLAHDLPERREPLLLTGRIALGGFMILCGFQHFKWDDFVITLVPTWMPGGGPFWTYVCGVLLILGGAGMLIPRTATLAAALSGLMIFLWVFMLHLPHAITATGEGHGQGEWTAVIEASAFSGLAFYLAGMRLRRGTVANSSE